MREIGLCGARDALAAAHRAEQDGGERDLQQDQRRRRCSAATMKPRTRIARNSLRLARAERLRGEGDRAHAQEGEQPEHAIEDHRSHRDAAEQRGIAEPADRRGRDDADQRRRQVRDHRGTRDGEHLRAS